MTNSSRPGISLWSQTAIERTEYPALHDHHQADVTIIGAGFTGLRAGFELVSQGTNVMILDSQEPGYGASGRTGGQVNPMAHETPDQMRSKLGDVFGTRLSQAYINSADELFSVIKSNNLDCEPVQKGWIRAAHCRKAEKSLHSMQQGWAREGLDIEMIDTEELLRLSGSNSYRIGTLTKSAGCIQPLSYCRSMAKKISYMGGKIHGNTRVTSVVPEGNKWRVNFHDGSVLSDWVLFCTNGYTDNVLAGLNKTFIPLVSLQAATKPLSNEQYKKILPEGHTIADTRRVIYYSRRDNRNRILLGSLGRTPECSLASDKRRLITAFKTVYPSISENDIEYFWGGRVAFTPDLLPHLHEPAPGILAGLGFNGRGVAMGSTMGRVMAQRVLGKASKDLDIPTTDLPRYRFSDAKSLAIGLVIPYLETRDRWDIKISGVA